MVVTESWLPSTNGVVRSVQQVLAHLVDQGADVSLVAPGATQASVPDGVTHVLATPCVPLARLGYAASVPTPGLERFVRRHRPDVVHVASPFLLGAQAIRAGAELGVPTVAVYQTDVAAFAAAHGFAVASSSAWRWIVRTHRGATRTLVCTQDAVRALRVRGVPRVHHWQRGVDLELFDPARRSHAERRRLAGGRDVPVVGYLGRLALEKELHLLEALAERDDLALAVIGDGPSRELLQQRLPRATFTGFLGGEDLARATASLDVFVHPGRHETLCQGAMQAMAAGVPAVVPAAGGAAELVPDAAGRRFTPGSATQLADAVDAVLRDRDRLGERARELSQGRSLAASLRALEQHWAGAVAAHAAQRTAGPTGTAGTAEPSGVPTSRTRRTGAAA
ncbi:glycosyltransferase [Miniimonas arenae]|nr:glycosyltransferase [Miniimonas arenae]